MAGSAAQEPRASEARACSPVVPLSSLAVAPQTFSARIDRAEALRYLGYTGQDMDPALAARIERVMAACEEELAPRGLACAFALAEGPAAEAGAALRLAGTALRLPGKDIARHLAGAGAVAVLCCTLGAASEQRLRALAATDPLEAAVFDAACSAYVEAGVDALEQRVRAAAEAAGYALGSRFSPGYGDLPLSVQPQVLAVADATRKLGMSCAPSHMLVPSKSVTAFAGVFARTEAAPEVGGPDVAEPAAGARQGGLSENGAPPAHPSASARSACDVCRLRSGCALRARGLTCDRAR